MISVLIVDDCATARAALKLVLNAENGFQIVAEADNCESAVALAETHRPDVVTMDVYLRRENGFDITAQLMERSPRPVVIVTGVNPRNPELAFRAIEAGAVEVVPKLPSPTAKSFAADRDHLLRVLRTAAKVPVVHRFRSITRVQTSPPVRTASLRAVGSPSQPTPYSNDAISAPPQIAPRPETTPTDSRPRLQPDLVLFGASTGGPQLMSKILSALPVPFSKPIVIIQHIASGFSAGFAQWLENASGHEVVLVNETKHLGPGKVYVAPDYANVEITKQGTIRPVVPSEAEVGLIPSIDRTFESAAKAFGERALAVVCTGMGRDGSIGCIALRRAGATTIAQKPISCVVSSMPQMVISSACADHVLTPDEIVAYLEAI